MAMLLPDLLAEDPLCDNLFSLEAPPLSITHPDIAALNFKLDSLSLECNTQALQIEVERVKRQKLRSSIRSIRQKISLPCPDTMSLKGELQAVRENQNAINYQIDGEVSRLNTMSLRYFSRIHQILTVILPHVTMPPDEHFELIQMLDELVRTLHQFQVYQLPSCV